VGGTLTLSVFFWGIRSHGSQEVGAYIIMYVRLQSERTRQDNLEGLQDNFRTRQDIVKRKTALQLQTAITPASAYLF